MTRFRRARGGRLSCYHLAPAPAAGRRPNADRTAASASLAGASAGEIRGRISVRAEVQLRRRLAPERVAEEALAAGAAQVVAELGGARLRAQVFVGLFGAAEEVGDRFEV